MSDYWLNFIPEQPQYMLDAKMANLLKGLSWCGDNVTIKIYDTIQFIDAGSNFEQVSCPFCEFDLMDWWGDEMSLAYSQEPIFANIGVVTPCCNKNTTLNDLDYYSPQGFCKTMIEMQPFLYKGVHQVPQEQQKEMICQELLKITNVKWRVISRHY